MSQSSSSTVKDDSSNSSTDSSHTIRADSKTPSPIVFQAPFEPVSDYEPAMSLHEDDASESEPEVGGDGVDVNGFEEDLQIEHGSHSEEDGQEHDNDAEVEESSSEESLAQEDEQQQLMSSEAMLYMDLDETVRIDDDHALSPYSDSGSSSEAQDDDDDTNRYDIFSPTIRTEIDKTAWRQFYPDDPSDSDEDLDAERVEEILTLAEERLRQQEEALHCLRLSSKMKHSDLLQKKSQLPPPYMRSSKGPVKPDAKALLDPKMRALADKPRVIQESILVKKVDKKNVASGLSTHYDLPRTQLTPELKREMQLLSMRAVLDPKRMYKRQGKFKLPEYSQVGTIIEGPTDFFGGRLTKKERSRTFVQQALRTESETGRFKRKYSELQKRKSSGKKAFYKALLAKRRRVK